MGGPHDLLAGRRRGRLDGRATVPRVAPLEHSGVRGVNRWLAPWVAALRIARRQALRAKGRTALSAVMVGLPLLLLAALAVLGLSLLPTGATFVASQLGPDAQALLRPTDCAPLAHPPNELNASGCGSLDEDSRPGPLYLAADDAAQLALDTVPGLELVEMLDGTARLDGDQRNGVVRIRQLDTLGPAAATVPLLEGRLPHAAEEIALGARTMRALGLTLGDSVDVATTTSTAIAVVTGVVSATYHGAVMTPAALTLDGPEPSWLVAGTTPVPWAEVVALNEAGFEVVSRDVLHHPPAPHEVPFEQRYGAPTDTTAVAQVGLVAALVILEVVLLVGPAFAVGARRQARSLALVAATGGTRRDLRRIVLANGVVVGLGSSVLGAVTAVRWPRYDPAATFPNLVVPWWTAGIVAVGTIIAVLASWFPARQAARVDVVAALAGRRSEARPRPALGIAGLVAAALGVPLSVYGGYSGSTALAGAGGVLVVLGLVAASGLLISAVGTLARRTGVATRIALRDLARQRGRTAPAAAAVLGAIAAATAGAVYMAAEAAHSTASWIPETDEGTVKVRLSGWQSGSFATDQDAAAVRRAILDIDPGADVATLYAAFPVEAPAPGSWWGMDPTEDESRVCPLYRIDVPSEQDRAEHADDPRCPEAFHMPSYWGSSMLHAYVDPMSGVLVDDGSAFAIMADERFPAIAPALAEGRVVVGQYAALWEDGTVRLALGDGDSMHEVRALPGAWVEGDDIGALHSLVLPPDALGQIDAGLQTVPHAVVAAPSTPWTSEQEDALVAQVEGVNPDLAAEVERAPDRDVSLTVLALVGSAGILALAATWIASGLAAVESRADLATLAAVGAAPRVRRRVAGLQSAFLTATGVLPGLVGGLAVGWARSEERRVGKECR